MKKVNKRLIGFIIGGTILGVTGLSSTKKGRGLIGRFLQTVSDAGHKILETAELLGSKIIKKP